MTSKGKHNTSILSLLRADDSNVILIHIGKCGGTTVKKEFRAAGYNFRPWHIKKVVYNPTKKYIIVIRNPIERFISAFNWRYKLVVESEAQKDRFPGEYERLKKYGSVNTLAEAIYDSEGHKVLKLKTPEHYIHHIKEDIVFYLGKFLNHCAPEDILSVMTTPDIKRDLELNFNIVTERIDNENSDSSKEALSDLALNNLLKHLRPDYKCIEKLNELGVLSTAQYNYLSAQTF